MAVLALNTFGLPQPREPPARQVSQEMFHDLWPRLPLWEVPITSITNGVHLPSWLNNDLAALYDQYLQPELRDRSTTPDLGAGGEIPDEELLEGASPAQAPPG